MKLSIIIPAYNEEDRIVITLEKTLTYLAEQSCDAELLVVSDGSTDSTGRSVASLSAPGNVKVAFLEYHPNQGKGYAVRYGMIRGKGDVVMFMDADYSVPIEALEQGLKLLDEGYDIAIASRAVAGAVINQRQNRMRELSARLYTWIQNHYLGLSYPDTQCGFKLFTRSAARLLFTEQRLNSVIFDPEILWLAKRHGIKTAEFPVAWTHNEDSRIQYDSFRKSLFVFQELFRIKGLHRR
jgi:glycosyltransferase involved in cell wall biosynthesis